MMACAEPILWCLHAGIVRSAEVDQNQHITVVLWRDMVGA